ncbi:MAG: FliH/SctL family protein [bacterium]
MGIIKKSGKSDYPENQQIPENQGQIDIQQIQTNQIQTNLNEANFKPKIIGSIIKAENVGTDLISLNLTEEKIAKKIIKRTEIAAPVNEIVEELKDVNIVTKSNIEFELEQEKEKYQKLNEELQQKINEQEQKIKEIENQKKTILEQAQKQAESIVQKAVEEANKKAQEIMNNAYNEGYQKGLSEGQKAIEQKYIQKIQELEQQISTISSIRQSIVKEFEKEIIDLVFEVAEKIINKKIQEEPSIVTSYLSELLSKVERSKSITIWVNPEELEEVRNYREKIKHLLEDVENLTVAPDERIGKGGCIIETNFGKIDSRISTKLEVLKEIILRTK